MTVIEIEPKFFQDVETASEAVVKWWEFALKVSSEQSGMHLGYEALQHFAANLAKHVDELLTKFERSIQVFPFNLWVGSQPCPQLIACAKLARIDVNHCRWPMGYYSSATHHEVRIKHEGTLLGSWFG